MVKDFDSDLFLLETVDILQGIPESMCPDKNIPWLCLVSGNGCAIILIEFFLVDATPGVVIVLGRLYESGAV